MATIAPRGAIDIANVDDLREQLDRACSTPALVLTVNCAEVSFLAACGVNAIDAARTRLRADGRDLQVTNATGIVRRVFELCGLSDLLVTDLP
jgi:anti-anti-sigma factor